MLLCRPAVCVSTHFFMCKCFVEVGSKDEVTIYTSNSPGLGIQCVARVATSAVAVLAAACVVCPCGPSSLSGELENWQEQGDLGPWVSSSSLQPTKESRGCYPAAVSRAAQGDLLCITHFNPEKRTNKQANNNSKQPQVSRRVRRKKLDDGN